MIQNLPESVRQQILTFLETGNFLAARDLRDTFNEKQVEAETQGQAVLVLSKELDGMSQEAVV